MRIGHRSLRVTSDTEVRPRETKNRPQRIYEIGCSLPDADPDIPILKQTKARYAKLH